MTTNESTVRYWRHDPTGSLLEAKHSGVGRFYASTGEMTPVHVLSDAELDAIKAEAYDEGVRRTLRYAGMPADTWWRNPYAESED